MFIVSFIFYVRTVFIVTELVYYIYASVIVSDSLNGCSRLICLVLEIAALCDISVRSAVYKSSYLLTIEVKLLSELHSKSQRLQINALLLVPFLSGE